MAVLASAPGAVAQKTIEPPANAPATVAWNARQGRLSLRYRGAVILDAAIRAEDAEGRAVAGVEVKLEPSETVGEKVEQRLRFVPAKPQEGVKLVLRGTAIGSEEAFPAETGSEAQKRFPYVRNSVGLSRNLRNNAVYDRRWDWVLVGPADGATRIQPEREEKQRITFTWESRGASLELVFRPRFYQKHKDIAHFEPWTYKAWKGSMTGYCTWWAYRGDFSQTTLDQIVDVFAEKKLADFGYRYIQLDDAYQIGNGSCPQNWLTWNEKFPGGADYTIRKIRSAGLEPGIWVHRVHRPSDPHVADIGKQHPDWFVRKPNGELFMDQGFYCLNTQNKDALDGMARPIYRELKKQGWGYVKIDGAGDLLYSYRNQPEHFKKIGTTPGESLRAWDQVAREELGRDVYILTCWGVQPGLNSIGLVDGCRLGSDGFGPAGLQRFTSWNGVVWRNDPDHCDILAEWLKDKTTMKTFGAQAAMTDTIEQPSVVSMAGGVLMVSDKAEAYKDDGNLEGMKRSAPVLFTVPGQLYDYSQRGPGDYGAPLRGGEATWWMLEIDRPFDHWSVLARFNWRQEKLGWKRPGAPETEVKFADLGLAEDREYLVFEFWTQTFLGKSKGSFKAPAQDASNGLQVFAIREARPHPWILSTTRHISQGGVSLLDERWDDDRKILSGKSSVVIGDPYVLTVHLPRGFRLRSAEIGGEKVEFANQTETATVRIVPSATKTVEWKIAFAAGAGAIDLGSLLEDMLDRSQIAEFFGSGLGINPYKDWWRRVEKDGWMTCWWPMPFRKSAELNITNQGMSESIEAEFDDIGIAAWKWTDRTMYFHSAWRGENLIETVGDDLKNMKEWNYITIAGKGVYVGDSLSLYNRPRMDWHIGPWWGEGDEKIFVDGESFPSHFGTGSEDYYGYAFNSTSPFEAPFHAQPIAEANWGIGHTTDERVRIHDRIPFKTKFRFDMELFHWQPKRKIDYATTTHWYACDGATSNGQATPEKVREKVAQPWAGPDETPATNSR
jgi:hypothetical protein